MHARMIIISTIIILNLPRQVQINSPGDLSELTDFQACII